MQVGNWKDAEQKLERCKKKKASIIIDACLNGFI